MSAAKTLGTGSVASGDESWFERGMKLDRTRWWTLGATRLAVVARLVIGGLGDSDNVDCSETGGKGRALSVRSTVIKKERGIGLVSGMDGRGLGYNGDRVVRVLSPLTTWEAATTDAG